MNTFEAMQTLSPTDQDRLVWAPDAIRSICFLAASYLAYASKLWTLVGAVCFFVGAYLLLPEMTSHSATQAP
jgi:hypothetical protein